MTEMFFVRIPSPKAMATTKRTGQLTREARVFRLVHISRIYFVWIWKSFHNATHTEIVYSGGSGEGATNCTGWEGVLFGHAISSSIRGEAPRRLCVVTMPRKEQWYQRLNGGSDMMFYHQPRPLSQKVEDDDGEEVFACVPSDNNQHTEEEKARARLFPLVDILRCCAGRRNPYL